jgi:FkbM family methyltransferase
MHSNNDSYLRQAGHKFELLWRLLCPARWYLRSFPVQRGKGFVLDRLVIPALPPWPLEYEARVAGHGRIKLRYRETIGLSTLLYGPFEDAELRFAAGIIGRGDTVMDVGANIGLFTVVLARAVGPDGRVIAIEPVSGNADRILANLGLNRLANVCLLQAAAGREDGHVDLNMSNDPAYPSIHQVAECKANGSSIRVAVQRLDGIWQDSGKPHISFIKIDVEGAELEVLRGARELLAQCRPDLLLEANDRLTANSLRDELAPLGYTLHQPPGFSVHNYFATCKQALKL